MFQPVMIIGSHRSGTSILYRVLNATGCFNAVTAFHVLMRERLIDLHRSGGWEAARLEMAASFAEQRLSDEYGRPVTPDTLEEYCWALGHSGRRPVLDDVHKSRFLAFCEDLQAVQEPDRPLLLKNPYDTNRFLFVRDILPQARFVFIFRDPVEIIDSQMRLIRQMLHERANYDALLHPFYRRIYDFAPAREVASWALSEHLPLLFRMVFNNVSANCDYAVKHFGELGGAAMGITYQELCNDAAGRVARVLEFLDLQDRNRAGYEQMVRPRQLPPIPGVARRQELIRRRNRRYCDMFGV